MRKAVKCPVKKNKLSISLLIAASLVSAFVCLFSLTNKLYANEYTQYPGLAHIQTVFSDGSFTIEELVREAKQKNIKILILGDSLLKKWEYGIWPLRALVKKTVKENSIFQNGISQYLNAIEDARRNNPDIVLIAGCEVTPYYYWDGSLLKGNLKLYDWHKHFLIVGLETLDDYRNIPVVGNRSLFLTSARQLFSLWPLLLIISGIILLKLKQKAPAAKKISYTLILSGLLFLANNIPFNVSKYNQYSLDVGIGPYQDTIDYVNQKNGLTFWAHPEAEFRNSFNGIGVITNSYKHYLGQAKDYTGFAAIYADKNSAVEPANTWDKILLEYCRGIREKPVFGYGEIHYDANTPKDFDSIQTIFLLEYFDKRSVLEAMRSGKMYAKLNKTDNDFSLSDFSISGLDLREKVRMGDEITLNNPAKIFIDTEFSYHQAKKAYVDLIRNGKVVQSFILDKEQQGIEYQDDYYRKDEKIYYRLEIESDFYRIISNPIFVRFN